LERCLTEFSAVIEEFVDSTRTELGITDETNV
jgi:hypothetical protein